MHKLMGNGALRRDRHHVGEITHRIHILAIRSASLDQSNGRHCLSSVARSSTKSSCSSRHSERNVSTDKGGSG